MLRVGVIGAGANTKKFHIPLLQKIQGVEVVSVVNRSPASSAAAAAEFGIAATPATWRELVASPDVDAVVIGTWPYTHCEMTLAALAAGKHVLCEARIARDAAEARQMLAAARRSPNLVAQVVPSPFSLPWDATITRMVREGFLGELIAANVRGVSSAFADAEGAPLHWRHDRDLSGNNIMMMGIFYEALMRWIGPASSVMAMGTVAVRKRTRGADAVDAEIPDHLNVLARYGGGARAHLQFSAVTGLAESTMEFWLHGTRGTIALTPLSRDAPLRAGARGGSLQPVEVPPEERAAWRVEEEFVGAIRGDEKVRRTTFEDGVRYMEFTDAVHASLSSGREVRVRSLEDAPHTSAL